VGESVTRRPPRLSIPPGGAGAGEGQVRYMKRKCKGGSKTSSKGTTLPSPWFYFKAVGSEKVRWCQPDGLLFDFQSGLITIVEVKLQHTGGGVVAGETPLLPPSRASLPARSVEVYVRGNCEVVRQRYTFSGDVFSCFRTLRWLRRTALASISLNLDSPPPKAVSSSGGSPSHPEVASRHSGSRPPRRSGYGVLWQVLLPENLSAAVPPFSAGTR
jgi:hypothetical protein